jgi:hypothetical protein
MRSEKKGFYSVWRQPPEGEKKKRKRGEKEEKKRRKRGEKEKKTRPQGA